MSDHSTAPRLAIPVALLLGLAAVVVVANRHQPITGNALIFARLSYEVLDRGPGACQTSAVNKACGYPVLSLPWVAWLGANRGLKASSTLLTLLALLACVPFFRGGNRALGIPPGLLGLELLVVALNPLFMYQLVSGWSDSAFLGAAVLSFVALGRLLERDEPTLGDAVLYAAALAFALWLKHQAISLPVLHLAWALGRWPRLRRLWGEHRRVAIAGLFGLGLFAVLVVLGRRGLVPGFNLGEAKTRYPFVWSARTLVELGVFAGLTLHVLLLVPLARPARAMLAPALVVAAYLPMFLFNAGALANPRWYLPLLPFLALLVARGWTALPRWAGLTLGVLFLLVNVPLTLGYNVEPLHGWLAARGLRLPPHWNLGATSEMPSLRRALEHVNRERAPFPVYVHHYYYGGGARGVLPRGGFFDPGVEVLEMAAEADVRHERFYVLNLNPGHDSALTPRLLLCDGPGPGAQGHLCMGVPRRPGDRLLPYRFWPGDIPRPEWDAGFAGPPTAPPPPSRLP